MGKLTETTLKTLFALSKNQCAFPNCNEKLIMDDNVIVGEICHIKAQSKNGPRFDKEQTQKENNGIENLIILCPKHHKIIDTQPESYTVELLKEMKGTHEKCNYEIKPDDSDLFFAKLIYNHTINKMEIDNVEEINAKTIQNLNIKSTKKTVKLNPPANCIGSDNKMRNYVKHLIEQYQKFASKQNDRIFNYSIIYTNIKKEFHANWDFVDKEKFNDLVDYMQKKINGTIIGKSNIRKGIKNYSSYSEYINRM